MTFPARWEPGKPQFKQPRIVSKLKARRQTAKEKRDAYADVDARDGKRCRCCGRQGNPNATTTIGRIHRAHIHDAGTQGAMAAANLLSLCWICADFETAKRLFILGTNANRSVKFEVLKDAAAAIFGSGELPKHVKVIALGRRQRYGV